MSFTGQDVVASENCEQTFPKKPQVRTATG